MENNNNNNNTVEKKLYGLAQGLAWSSLIARLILNPDAPPLLPPCPRVGDGGHA